MKFSTDDLNARYDDMTSSVVCSCEAATPIVGGVPADEATLRAFIRHHLKITDEVQANAAYSRMLSEELGERPVPSSDGELQEKLTYGMMKIRRTPLGPYLGNWMIHACLKTAASRLGIFKDFRGTKGNWAEAGRVLPYGISVLDSRPDCVYLIGPDGNPAETVFEEFKGRVQTPKGSVSVVHHSESVPPGTRFDFTFQFIMGDLREDDIADVLALMMIVGLGSVKSLGNGKFRILSAEIQRPQRTPGRKKKLEVHEISA